MNRREKQRAIALTVIAIALAALALLWHARTRRPAPEPAPTPTATPAPSFTAAPMPTPSPAASPAPTATPAPLRSEAFELPVRGAAGYASVSLKLRERPDASSPALGTLDAGTPFRIAGESGAWWRVEAQAAGGWVSRRYCLINLPDIIPSIVYDATNTYSSRVRSSKKALPGITGKGLYPGKAQNNRLGERQFIMPVLYATAEKVYAAQRYALQNNETLVLYEAYRPYDVQMTIVRALTRLADSDETVKDGISSAPWTLSWFASTRLSNHQRGCAVDVSLAKINASEQARSGAYGYTRVTSATRYEMPTPMHELSRASAAFSGPVNSKSRTAWRQAAPAASMNDAALRLQSYCTKAGLTPLASEWWHFNDLDAAEATDANPSSGRYTLSRCMSVAPEAP